jgi:TatA/E family protein of Tat protein translocase
MFGPLGFQEVVFILVLALLIFGPKRLPEIGRTIGKGMAQFRKASTDLRRSIESEVALEERPEPPRRPTPALRETKPRATPAQEPAPPPDEPVQPA